MNQEGTNYKRQIFLAVGETCKAIFRSTPDFKDRTSDILGSSSAEVLTLHLEYPTVGVRVGRRESVLVVVA